MQVLNGSRLYSASDLVYFLACRHHTYLDLVDLETPLPKADDDPEAALLQEKGEEHERAYLAQLDSSGHRVVAVPATGSLLARAQATRTAMVSGAEVIYQAVLLDGPWHGYADFLRRVDAPSDFGSFSYEVVDTKLARSPTPGHVIQLCVYCDLLGVAQGLPPHSMHLVLGDGREVSFRVADLSHYYANVKRQFEALCRNRPDGSYPEPCPHCEICRWRQLCGERWEQDDHLSLVANIQRRQIRRLKEAGITTVRALSGLPEGRGPSRIGQETLARLRHQALLQVRKRETGKDQFEVLPLQDGRGFARMPRPGPGDLFFDIEGDPLYPDGLEYLFGVYGANAGEVWFRPIWEHNHEEERQGSQQPPAIVWSQEAHHDRPASINCSTWSMAAWHAPRGGRSSGPPYLAFSQVSRREVARADASPLACAESADSISAGVRPSAGTPQAPVRCLRTSALSRSNASLRPASVSRASARTASSEACSSWRSFLTDGRRRRWRSRRRSVAIQRAAGTIDRITRPIPSGCRMASAAARRRGG